MFSRKSTKGFVSTNTLMGLAGAGVLSLLWWLGVDEDSSENEVQPLFETVKVAEFKLEFIEPGEIESAENVEIKSEVRSRITAGVSILEIVPEGSVVKKGDFLVRLDDATLQKDLLRQRISVHQAKAALVAEHFLQPGLLLILFQIPNDNILPGLRFWPSPKVHLG